ncbi:MAG: Ig-like domain-containing protein, partial [Sulfuricaulis sp.]|nr:Ig-like domain-containing protein [Sulfuricaulis sp.]
SGLSAGTTYYYQMVANNSAGTSTGSEQSFNTSSSGGGGGWEPPVVTLSVSATEPSNGATDVSVDTAVSAKFSMQINGSTVDTESIYVTDSDGNKIEGTASTDSYNAVFTTATSLSYGATYTTIATTKIQAANWAGTQMDSNYSWSFTTESAPIVPTPTPAPTVTSSPTPAVTSSPTPIPVVVATQTSTPATTPTLSAEATPTPTITAETPTPTPSPTPTPVYEGSVTLSKEVAYLSGDTVIVTVADNDRNTGAETEEILTTAIKITGDNYYIGNDLLLDLNEDGADSGTFLATIKTGTTTSGGADSVERSNIGVVYAIQDGTVTVTYSPDAFVSVAKKLSFSSFDAQLSFDRPVYRIGEYAGITLKDAESNADHATAETLTDEVYIDTSSFNTAGVRMLETGTDTGVF